MPEYRAYILGSDATYSFALNLIASTNQRRANEPSSSLTAKTSSFGKARAKSRHIGQKSKVADTGALDQPKFRLPRRGSCS